MEYQRYQLSKKEVCKYSLQYLLVFLFIGKLFYNSFGAGLVGCIALPFLLKRKANELAKCRQKTLLIQFKDFILSFSASLKAGYSIENSFLEAYRDLQFMYETDTDMLKECKFMQRQMQNNMVLEILLQDFGNRSGITDIQDFASIFAIAKHSGGNLNKIIQNTVRIISEKIEIKEDIQILLAAKKFEQTIMDIIPIAIMLYISIASPGYFDALYGNVVGILIMTVCLIIYFFALFLSQKIMEIEV